MANILIDPMTQMQVDVGGRPLAVQAPIGPDDTISPWMDPDIKQMDVPAPYTAAQGAQDYQKLTQDEPWSFGKMLSTGLTFPLRAIAGGLEELKGAVGAPTLEDQVAQMRGQLPGQSSEVAPGDRFMGLITGRTRDEEAALNTVRQRFLQNAYERKTGIATNKAELDLRKSGYEILKVQPEMQTARLKLSWLPQLNQSLLESRSATAAAANANRAETLLDTEHKRGLYQRQEELFKRLQSNDLKLEDMTDAQLFELTGGDPAAAKTVIEAAKARRSLPKEDTGQPRNVLQVQAREDIKGLEEKIDKLIADRTAVLNKEVEPLTAQQKQYNAMNWVAKIGQKDPSKDIAERQAQLRDMPTLKGDLLSAVSSKALTPQQALAIAGGKGTFEQFLVDRSQLSSLLPAQTVPGQQTYGTATQAAPTAPQAATPPTAAEPPDMAAARADLTARWTKEVGPIDKPNAAGVSFEDFLRKAYYPQWKKGQK